MISSSFHDWSTTPAAGKSPASPDNNQYKNDWGGWQLPENPWLKNIQPPQEQAQGAAPVLDNPEAPARQPDYQMPDQSQLLHPMVQPKATPSGGLFAQFMNRITNPGGAPTDHTMPVRSSGFGGIGSFLAPMTGSIRDMVRGAASAPTGISSIMAPDYFRQTNNGESLLKRIDGQPVPPTLSPEAADAQMGITPEMRQRLEDMIGSGRVQF